MHSEKKGASLTAPCDRALVTAPTRCGWAGAGASLLSVHWLWRSLALPVCSPTPLGSIPTRVCQLHPRNGELAQPRYVDRTNFSQPARPRAGAARFPFAACGTANITLLLVLGTANGEGAVPDFARQRAEVPDLVSILESWALSSVPEEWGQGASDAELREAERTLKVRLPSALRGIYQVSDGLSILGGNLNFHPLEPTQARLGLTNASDKLREWKWPIPQELLVFGDNGADELFGLWLLGAPDQRISSPVVEVGEIFKAKAFAVVGTDLCRFLKAWTAFYTLRDVQEETVEPEALDVLGVPNELREDADDEHLFRRFFAWADPDLPDVNPDPYKRGVTAVNLRRMFGP